MSVSLADVRTKIAGRLATVQGIGQVHDYFRAVTTMAELNDWFRRSGRLHFWCVSLAPSDAYVTVGKDGPGRFPSNYELAHYGFQIHGFYALDDANGSEKVFADIVERVIAAFRADKKLGDTVIDSGPLQWVEGGGPESMRMMPPGEGGALCHYARLALRVKVQTEP